MSDAKTEIVPPTLWQRILAGLRWFDDAVDFSYDDIQDRRIARVEKELAALKSRLET